MTLDSIDSRRASIAATRARQLIIQIGHNAGGQGAHYGPALSLVEVFATLYGGATNVTPENTSARNRDRIVLSKGHGSLALYTILHEYGFIDHETLHNAETDGSELPGQPIRNLKLGIEFSSGSLGMGLSFGVGLALSARMASSPRSIYVVLGDGETNEGSVWEAAMSATHFQLDNLTAIIDVNELQSDGPTSQIMSGDLSMMWRGFGWMVYEVDGHSIDELTRALARNTPGAPTCILAKTVKGKGVSFMEGAPEWHHGRLTESQYQTAVKDTSVSEATS